jgi:hypothetical protein
MLSLTGQAAAQPHYTDIFGAADVTVASRYGTWDPTAFDVVPLG